MTMNAATWNDINRNLTGVRLNFNPPALVGRAFSAPGFIHVQGGLRGLKRKIKRMSYQGLYISLQIRLEQILNQCIGLEKRKNNLDI